MPKKSTVLLSAAAGALAVFAPSIAVGPAAAAGSGTAITATAKGNCEAEFVLTNYTNSANYWAEYWFESEEPVPALNAPADSLSPPWTRTWGVPFARPVGDPPLRGGLGEGIDPWVAGGGFPYNSSAQPDGFVTTKTIDVRHTVTNGPLANNYPPAPEPDANGNLTIGYRVNLGPQTGDRTAPQHLVVTECKETPPPNGSLDGGSADGSLDWGSLEGSLDWGSHS